MIEESEALKREGEKLEQEVSSLQGTILAQQAAYQKEQENQKKVHEKEMEELTGKLMKLVSLADTQASDKEEAWKATEKTFQSQISSLQEAQGELQDQVEELASKLSEVSKQNLEKDQAIRALNEDMEVLLELKRMVKTSAKSFKEGYLDKLDPSLTQWTTRWFVLDGHTLSYYTSHGVSAWKSGEIKLTDASVFGKCNDTAEKKNCIALIPVPGGRKYIFAASRKKVRNDWLEMIGSKTPARKVKNMDEHEDVAGTDSIPDSSYVAHCFVEQFSANAKSRRPKHLALFENCVLAWDDNQKRFPSQYQNSATVLSVHTGDAAADSMADNVAYIGPPDEEERLLVFHTTGETVRVVADTIADAKEIEEAVLGALKKQQDNYIADDDQGHAQSMVSGTLEKFVKNGKNAHNKFFKFHNTGIIQWVLCLRDRTVLP